MSEVATLENILWIWLFNTIVVTALIASIIYMHNKKNNEKHDATAQELLVLKEGQRTLIDRIERLRNQFEEAELNVNNYIIFNHTRRRILERLDAYVTREGGWKITGDESKIPPEYVAKEVTIYVVLKDGKASELFGGLNG